MLKLNTDFEISISCEEKSGKMNRIINKPTSMLIAQLPPLDPCRKDYSDANNEFRWKEKQPVVVFTLSNSALKRQNGQKMMTQAVVFSFSKRLRETQNKARHAAAGERVFVRACGGSHAAFCAPVSRGWRCWRRIHPHLFILKLLLQAAY